VAGLIVGVAGYERRVFERTRLLRIALAGPGRYGSTVISCRNDERQATQHAATWSRPRRRRFGPARESHRWWAHALVVLGLLVANLALYRGTLDLGFLSVDDPDYVQNNPYIESLSAANLKHIFTRRIPPTYAPANLLSYARTLHWPRGKGAAAIHLIECLLAWIVVCRSYLLAFTIAAPNPALAAAATLFLLHPAMSKSWPGFPARKDLVATGFAARGHGRLPCCIGGATRWGIAWSGGRASREP